MYSTINGVSYISGDFGKYDNTIKNNSVRYARNSVDNFKKYLSNYVTPEIAVPKFSKPEDVDIFVKQTDTFVKQLKENESKRTPVDFVQKYMSGDIKDGKIDSIALMSASYEELGKTEVSKDELENQIKSTSANPDNVTADALDLNKDGKIDLAEYSTSILLSDALSTNDKEISVNNIDGVVTNKGLNAINPFSEKNNVSEAYKTYSYLYDFYKLGEAQKEFLSDSNNIS